MAAEVDVLPLTADRWADLGSLFGPNGALDGCWCRWFMQSSAEYAAGRGEANRQAMKAQVEAGDVPGLIAYVDGAPAAWVAVGPRTAYPRLARSRITKPVDEQPAWAMPCFFTRREFRGLGLQEALVEAATAWAAGQGATVVEAYPVDPGGARIDAGGGFHGFLSCFTRAGFDEVVRRTPRRPVVRKRV